jgi:hypothetical protein
MTGGVATAAVVAVVAVAGSDCGPHRIQVLNMGGSVWLLLVDHLKIELS